MALVEQPMQPPRLDEAGAFGEFVASELRLLSQADRTRYLLFIYFSLKYLFNGRHLISA